MILFGNAIVSRSNADASQGRSKCLVVTPRLGDPGWAGYFDPVQCDKHNDASRSIRTDGYQMSIRYREHQPQGRLGRVIRINQGPIKPRSLRLRGSGFEPASPPSPNVIEGDNHASPDMDPGHWVSRHYLPRRQFIDLIAEMYRLFNQHL